MNWSQWLGGLVCWPGCVCVDWSDVCRPRCVRVCLVRVRSDTLYVAVFWWVVFCVIVILVELCAVVANCQLPNTKNTGMLSVWSGHNNHNLWAHDFWLRVVLWSKHHPRTTTMIHNKCMLIIHKLSRLGSMYGRAVHLVFDWMYGESGLLVEGGNTSGQKKSAAQCFKWFY